MAAITHSKAVMVRSTEPTRAEILTDAPSESAATALRGRGRSAGPETGETGVTVDIGNRGSRPYV